MPRGHAFLLPTVLVTAAAAALGAAVLAVDAIESRSVQAVDAALTEAGQGWVQVEADGLQVRLSGMAESESQRFRALSVAGMVVDSSRLIDGMDVRPAAELRAPEYTVEVLRNDDGISLIGLIPAETDREALLRAVESQAGGVAVSDMLETSTFPAPDTWAEALDFGLEALERLPRSKISITPSRLTVTAITASAAERARLEADLARQAPEGLTLDLNLSAPRPVITPFTLRFLIDARGARFDACSADTEAARTRILAAAVAAGAAGKSTCTIGLGVPSPSWAEAVATSIAALAELGGGTLTFSDADISLVAAENVAQAQFDRVVGELENRLPDVFSLTAVLPEKRDNTRPEGPPEFLATLSPEGQLQMRGRLPDEAVRGIVGAFAVARFGTGSVYDATRLDNGLPQGWPRRVLAALEALAELENGSALVQPDLVAVRGSTGNTEANAEIARLLAEKLGEGAKFEISVNYEESLDPVAALPTPEECVGRINAVLAEQKITFAPGSPDISGESLQTLDRIADAMKDCTEVPMEIGAHSDSQGREEMNLALSQARADAVLNGLLARRVLTSNLRAVGYGETRPIADNSTEEGREANRRIEFTLIVPEEEAAANADGAAGAEAGEAAGATPEGEADPTAAEPEGGNEQN